jgi:hypothetical protein
VWRTHVRHVWCTCSAQSRIVHASLSHICSQVLLHELAHNRFDDHDDDFKARRWALALALAQTSPTTPDPTRTPALTLTQALALTRTPTASRRSIPS